MPLSAERITTRVAVAMPPGAGSSRVKKTTRVPSVVTTAWLLIVWLVGPGS